MLVSIPVELRKFFNGKRQIKRSCGSLREVTTYPEAVAVSQGEKGKALLDEIMAKYYEIDPLVFSAEKLLESLFATHDNQGRILPESKWHKSKVSKADCKILATPKNNQEEYDRLVNRLRAIMSSFLDAEITVPDVDIDSDFKAIESQIDMSRGGIMSPTKYRDDPISKQIADDLMEQLNFHNDQMKEKLIKAGTPFWYNWSRVGWIKDKTNQMMNSETMKERMSITQMKEFEQMMFQAEGVTQDDIDRYYKIQSAYKDFTDKEYEKSLGRGTDLKGVKFSECMEQYHKDQRRSRYSAKSTKTERGSQEYFMNTMGDRDIALIDKKLGMEYINHLEKDYNNKQGNPLSKATIRKKVGAVRSVLKWAEEQPDYNFLNTWNDLSFENRGVAEKPRRSWEDAWLKELFQLDIDGDKHDGLKLQLRILVCTGCRLEEACALQMGDLKTLENGLKVISTERESLVVKRPRNGDMRAVRRKIPIMNILQEYIDAYLKTFTEEERKEDSTFLFVDRFNYYRRMSGGKYSNEASDVLIKAIDPVRLKYLNPKEFRLDLHSLRTTFNRITADAFIQDSTRKKIIGHTQSDRDKNYLMEPLSPSALQSAKQQLDNCDFNFIRGEK